MTENQPEAMHLRTRNILHLHAEGSGTQIEVDHVYAPEGAFDCEECGGKGHDPGMVGVTMSGDDHMYASGLLTAEEALVLANRLQRAASLVLESEEDAPDVEREAARFGEPPDTLPET